jgi:hypothetical protein
MYDTVTKQFYTNAGTGEFTVGANVYPTPTAPIEIESGGDKTKNLLQNNDTNLVNRGVTFTVNPDGSVTANGTATGADAQFWVSVDTSKLHGNYYFCACYTTQARVDAYAWDGTTRARVKKWNGTTNSGSSTNGTLQEIQIPEGHNVLLVLRVYSGTTVNNYTFYPMIVAPTETDPAWEPYGYQIPIRSNGLPSEYREVEYLESTGTQNIELPFGFDPTDAVDFDFSIDTSEVEDKYMVAPKTWNTNNNRFAMGVHIPNSGGVFAAAFGTQTTSLTYLTPQYVNDGLRHLWHYKNRNFAIPDLSIGLDVSQISFGGTTANLKLFYGYNAGTKGKIYRYTHYKSGAKVADLIPAVRKADSKPGMYDTVTGQFYTNAGTGEFAVGATVSAITLAEPLRRISAGSTAYTDHTDYKAQKVYRQCGVKVLDGTENWTIKGATGSETFRLENTEMPDALACLCTHFQWRPLNELIANNNSFCVNYTSAPKTLNVRCTTYTTVADFKAFLAAQYAAGTPVTIVYPLATATEESVTLPALPTERGATTTVDVATEVVPSNVEIVYRGK